jgi:hypothetical protein
VGLKEESQQLVDLHDHHTHSLIGDDDTSTSVYAAELRGIEMALNSTLSGIEQWAEQAKRGLVIFADSRAASKALCRPRLP